MKRWKKGSFPVGFQLLLIGTHEHAWNPTGERLEVGAPRSATHDVTSQDIITELRRIGDKVLDAPILKAADLGEVWRRDVKHIASTVGTINRAQRPGLPPQETHDKAWQWAALGAQAAAALTVMTLLRDWGLPYIQQDLQRRHEQFRAQYGDDHPLAGTLPGHPPASPWQPFLAAFDPGGQRAPTVKADYRANIGARTTVALDAELRRYPPLSLLPPALTATPTTLALLQLQQLWSDPRRIVKDCITCGKPFPVRYEGNESHQNHCSDRCRRAASSQRKGRESTPSARPIAGPPN